MIKRVAQSFVGFWLAIDMLVQTTIWGLLYIINPAWQFDARWTISGRCGAMAAKGWRIGIILADFIDDIPCIGPGHCARAAQTDLKLEAIGV